MYIKRCKGNCPKCGSDNLEYSVSGIGDDAMYYPFTCIDCNCSGKEWYNLEYFGTFSNYSTKLKLKTNQK